MRTGASVASGGGKEGSKLRMLLTSLSFILVGCVINNLILEVIVSKKANAYADPGAGGLLTFLQFSFVALMNLDQGFAFIGGKSGAVVSSSKTTSSLSGETTEKPGTLKRIASWLPFLAYKVPQVPFKHYVYQTFLFFTMSYLNNWAFKFNVSQPLHMVFRSANLITTFSLGYLFFGRK
jgi:UAA transporter family